ncbi:MAG: choice-of-anchor L domain-containing protein [Sphingobacteriales bacterium]|nr:MAG: choice-of-anchor L domain-containing protein [Sphingobacteriales bacterium]
MKSNLRLFLFSLIVSILNLICFQQQAKAQLFVDGSYSPDEMVTDFFSTTCVSVSNITWVADTAATQMGFFESSATNLGINAGILLTSGTINNAVGPNNTSSQTLAVSTEGDADLENLLGEIYGSWDACVLEFDMVATEEELVFEYVFGSEEYLEYVGSTFNDAFAFLVTGPGYDPNTNIALIPGTTTPVAINNVNHLSNTEFFTNNETGVVLEETTIQYDGFTTPLTATMNVVIGETYHIKLVVADIADQVLDSGVFISVGSLCGGELSPVSGFKVPEDLSGSTTVAFADDSKYATSWLWDFGDGSTSTLRNPGEHTFPAPGIYTVSLTVENYYEAVTYTQELTVGIVSGVGNTPKEFRQLTVYPNPATDLLTVVLPEDVIEATVNLYNNAGQLVLSQVAQNGVSVQIDLQLLPAGLYVAEAVSNNSTIRTKVWKQ